MSGQWDWVCLSPKKFKKPVNDIYKYANELKIIVYNKTDFDWALEQEEKVTEAWASQKTKNWPKGREDEAEKAEFTLVNEHFEVEVQRRNSKFL